MGKGETEGKEKRQTTTVRSGQCNLGNEATLYLGPTTGFWYAFLGASSHRVRPDRPNSFFFSLLLLTSPFSLLLLLLTFRSGSCSSSSSSSGVVVVVVIFLVDVLLLKRHSISQVFYIKSKCFARHYC